MTIAKREGKGGLGRKLSKRAAVYLPILLVGLLTVRLFGCAESLAYWPTRGETVPHLAVEEVWFESADGTRLHGWYIAPTVDRSDGGPAPAVLHMHGNAGKIGDHVDFSAFLRDSGIGVFIFDYAGYGASDSRGPIRRDGVLADTRAALAYLRAREDVDPERVGVYGFSLGGCFALAIAAEDEEVTSVATLSTFSSWKGAASDFVPVLGGWLMPSGLEPLDAVERLGDREYLIIHGTSDRIVRHRHSVILRDAATEAGVDVEYLSVDGADHNYFLDTHPESAAAITGFFERTLGVQAADDTGAEAEADANE